MSNIEITIVLDSAILESTVAGKVFQADASKMDNAGLAKVLRYGFQRIINDGCGGSDKTESDKHAIAEKRVASVMDGSIAERATRGTADEHAAYRKELNELLNGIIKQKDSKAKANQETRDKVWDQLPDDTRKALVSTALARHEKAKAELAALAGLDISL